MKNFVNYTLVFALFLTLLACEKEEEDNNVKPVISEIELGIDNSHEAYAGADFHIEASLIAENGIKTVVLSIHPENGHKKSINSGDGWEFDSVFTEFEGLKNTQFHKHINISAEADTGHYHLHFTVIDKLGNSATIEEEIEIKLPEDNEAPKITVSEHPESSSNFNTGDTIKIKGTVTDNKALGGIYIGLIRDNQSLANSEVNSSNSITLLHTHDFDNYKQYDFEAEIIVGAKYDNDITPDEITGDINWESSDYYLLVKSPDAFGGNVSFSDKFPFSINID